MDTRKNLHRARVARSLDLSRVSALTALSPAIVRKIDAGRYEELPGGLYARSYIRAFAEAVGVPPEQALKEVEELLPGVPDPLPALRQQAGGAVMAWLTARLARVWQRQPPAATAERSGTPAAAPDARGVLVRRGVAAAVDALILVAIGGAMTTLTAWMCGVSFISLLEQAGLAVAALLILPVLIYFGVFQGIGGRTPGARACGLPRTEPGKDSRLLIIAARALRKA